MHLRVPVAAGLVLVLPLLACGGLWTEAVAESFSGMTVDLEVSVPRTDPRYGDVQVLIDEGWMAAWEGRIGLGDAIGMSVQLDEAIADGQLDRGEVLILQDDARGWGAGPTDPQRRADLLEMKATIDARVRRERGFAELEPDDLLVERPEAPAAIADLEARIAAAGWIAGACRAEVVDGASFQSCSAGREGQAASIEVWRFATAAEADSVQAVPHGVLRRSGTTVVTVEVGLPGSDVPEAAETLADALVR